MAKSPLVLEGEGKACSWGPPKISLKGSRIAFPGGQLEQRIRQHKLLKVFLFQCRTLALIIRGSPLQLTKSSLVLSTRNINENLGMLYDWQTVAWRTYLGPSIKYEMEFLLISETNFFFSTLLSPPLFALRQISVSPIKQKEIHKWRAGLRNSHQGIFGGFQDIRSFSDVTAHWNVPRTDDVPTGHVVTTCIHKAAAPDWIQLGSWQLCQILGTSREV